MHKDDSVYKVVVRSMDNYSVILSSALSSACNYNYKQKINFTVDLLVYDMCA